MNKLKMHEAIHEVLGMFKLSSKAKVQIKTLSQGEKRKLCLALAFLGRPKLLFLDEPFAGLDLSSKEKFISTLGEINRTQKHGIVLTSKTIHEVQTICNKIGIMSEGQLVAYGTLSSL